MIKPAPLNRFAAFGTYSYHLGISNTTSLAAGISAGITNMSLDASKLNFGTTTVDPAVASSGLINQIRPDISAGLWLYSKDYFVGVAAQQIVPQNIAFSNNTVYVEKGKLVPHMFISAGYRMQLSRDVSLIAIYINPLCFTITIGFRY